MLYLKEYNALEAGSIDGKYTKAHDAAIQRATESHYEPPKLDTDPLCTLFVGRLNYDTTETSLQEHFNKYGHIENITVIRNKVTGLSQGYAFITFTSKRSAKEAYDYANKTILDHHTILVDFERSRNMKHWIPRRLGGGFGGKKESGQLRFGARDKPFRTQSKVPYEERKSDHWIHPTTRHRSSSPRYHSDTRRHRRHY